jgi:hypothetical protein
METVQRFKVFFQVENGFMAVEHPDGEVVSYDDYLELADRLRLAQARKSDYENENRDLKAQLTALNLPPPDPRFPPLDMQHLVKIAVKQSIEIDQLKIQLQASKNQLIEQQAHIDRAQGVYDASRKKAYDGFGDCPTCGHKAQVLQG